MRTRGTDEVERLGQLRSRSLGSCLTVVPASLGLPMLATLWGVDLDASADYGSHQLPYDPSHRTLYGYLWFIPLAERILVVEDNGFFGTHDELLARLSATAGGARVASAYWNDKAAVKFGAAEAGRTVVPVEEVRFGEPTPPGAAELDDLLAPFRALPEPGEDGADIDTGPSWVGTAVAMLERWTGVTLPDDVLDPEAHDVYVWSM